ncbi:MAG: DUF445 family protein [Bacillota bacterium]|nr:DUF445 family protein [Bacillota bacterium]
MLILIPILGAAIGYLTNKLAIWLIFRPYEPITLPLTKYKLQGLLPKRKNKIAQDMGLLVEKDLLPIEDIMASFQQPDTQRRITEGLAIAIYQHLSERIPLALPLGIRNLVFQQIQDVVRREAPAFFDKLMKSYTNNIAEHISLSTLVREKIEGFEIKELERLLMRIVSQELKHIEILGGVIGFFIGIVQVIIVSLL